MTKFVFLDTNVFLHCKSFTEINWIDIFNEAEKNEKIVIKLPYIVNKELDNAKSHNKKARNIQSKLKDLKDDEFKKNIFLDISVFPPKWSSLKSELARKLDENEPDCKIIAEILIFKEKHPEDEVYFVTGDNTPYFQAEALGINTIYWLGDDYKSIFLPTTTHKKKNKLTDLKILFKNGKADYELPAEKYMERDEFIAEEFSEFPNLMNGDKTEKKENSDDLTLGEIKEKGLNIEDWKKIFKPDSKFKEDVLTYYEEMKDYWRYNEVGLILRNEGNKPYNNVDIEIHTILEKNIEVKSKESLRRPNKPEFKIFPSFPYINISSLTSKPIKEPNVKYSSPHKIERENKNLWVFGYSVKKIQHNNTLSLYPITIKFPEEFKMEKIQFICNFKHDEEGETKEQKLTLDVSKLK